MDNIKEIMVLLNKAKRSQKEAGDMLESVSKMITNLDDVEKEKFEKKAKKIIKDYVAKTGNLLKEDNQKELYKLLYEVNYKKEGLIYMMRDVNIKTKYIEENDTSWKSIQIIDWGD